MTVTVEVPPAVERFADEVVAVLSDFGLVAAYLVGSVALGGYEERRSDIDVYAVVEHELDAAAKDDVHARVAALDPPARRLELVVYSRGEAASPEPRFELNFGDPDASPHWFVLDRAIAERRAVRLVGPLWGDLFAPVAREHVLDALVQALEWYERNDPVAAAVTAARAFAWLETGEWLAKPQAGAWLAARVREQVEAEL